MKSVSRRSLLMGTAALAAAPLVLSAARPVRAADVAVPWDKATIPAAYPERAMGKADAPVTMIEYSSLTCPHCAHFEVETLPRLKTDFIDTGKMQLIMRDYPLDKLALAAAMMARHAPEPMFFKLMSVLFENQVKWATADDPGAALRQYGILSGMSGDQVDAALQDKALLQAIMDVRKNASDVYGIDSTPSFVINGDMHAGALGYDAFADLINKAAQKS